MRPAFDVTVLEPTIDGLHKVLQRTLQMHSLPAVPGSRLAYSGTPEAAIQFFTLYKNARLACSRDDGINDSLLILRPHARQSHSGSTCNTQT